ncbi:MAG: hypothetical protein HYT12_03905 [Candidatus Liptonbacteria bacterium]|nr:hypothetical protein [Candidatus Liptonbacteria bacterium]
MEQTKSENQIPEKDFLLSIKPDGSSENSYLENGRVIRRVIYDAEGVKRTEILGKDIDNNEVSQFIIYNAAGHVERFEDIKSLYKAHHTEFNHILGVKSFFDELERRGEFNKPGH